MIKHLKTNCMYESGVELVVYTAVVNQYCSNYLYMMLGCCHLEVNNLACSSIFLKEESCII